MKNAFIVMLALAAAVPAMTPAFAKKGDQYINADGGCDPGDSKKGYWCIESLKTNNTKNDAKIVITPSTAPCKFDPAGNLTFASAGSCGLPTGKTKACTAIGGKLAKVGDLSFCSLPHATKR